MAISKRRFYSRYYLENKILYSDNYKKRYKTARMYNCSTGGLYFESQSRIIPGSSVYIKQVNKIPDDTYNPDAYANALKAEVGWCKKIDKNVFSGFGIGVQYNNDLSHKFA